MMYLGELLLVQSQSLTFITPLFFVSLKTLIPIMPSPLGRTQIQLEVDWGWRLLLEAARPDCIGLGQIAPIKLLGVKLCRFEVVDLIFWSEASVGNSASRKVWVYLLEFEHDRHPKTIQSGSLIQELLKKIFFRLLPSTFVR
uniref:Uncharacterized protein LOC104240645 n=1 Tax=Nicotiana sylvestris TaxID=4096 RepID=A0A1U7XW22_NICSY|nr:PREDICTED: uncharacterized protein LOC104240645 [Nicotiana sylvestris]